MSSDFKDLFGEDWRPSDFLGGPEGAGEGNASGGSSNPLSANGGLRQRWQPQSEFTSEVENRAPRSLNEKEVKVMGVYIQQEQGLQAQHFVLFRDNRAA